MTSDLEIGLYIFLLAGFLGTTSSPGAPAAAHAPHVSPPRSGI